jgi:hypothetical protein
MNFNLSIHKCLIFVITEKCDANSTKKISFPWTYSDKCDNIFYVSVLKGIMAISRREKCSLAIIVIKIYIKEMVEP